MGSVLKGSEEVGVNFVRKTDYMRMSYNSSLRIRL
jgi:hypothetical protein